MKKYLLTLFALILLAGTSCQEKIDIEKEKEVILSVIKAESEAARVGDYNGLISSYIQDEYNTRLNLGEDGYQIITGWDQLGSMFENFKERSEEDMSSVTNSKENAVIKVMGKTAWVICDNIWEGSDEEGQWKNETIQITFLEKVNGEWKFSFAAWLFKPEPEDDDDAEEIEEGEGESETEETE